MDYSDLSKLLSCARMYQHSRIERLRTPGERMAHSFGKGWHAIHQEWARLQLAGRTEYSPDDVTEWVLSTIGWQDNPEDYRTGDKLRRAFRAYHERYALEQFQYDAAEQSFTFEYAPDLEPIEGRIDAVVRADAGWGNGVQRWLVDYKTTSMLRGDWVEYYRVSNQFKYYYLNEKNNFPDLAGVCVDVYHATSGNKRGKTEGERNGDRFYRMFFQYSPLQLDEAIRDFAVANTTREMYAELGYWPKNTSACHQFGVSCPFLELCEATTEELRNKLRAGYEVEDFSPHTPVLTAGMP